MEEVELKRLRRDDVGSGAYLDAVMQRMKATSLRFDGGAEPLVQQVWGLYAKGTPELGLWVALHDGKIVGHAVGDVRNWCGRTIAWISQVVMDEAAPVELKDMFLRAVDAWVCEVNTWAKTLAPHWTTFNEVIFSTHRNAMAWMRHSGFEDYRVLMRRVVR